MPRRLIPLMAFALSAPASADLGKGLDAAAASKWQEAYKEFRTPAERGNSSAQVNLGNLYMKGLGVEQSYPEALKWYEKAALQGNPLAQAKMGVLYFYGLGVPEDHAKAIEWLVRAGDQGDAEAAMVLAHLYGAGDGIAKNPKEAYLWSSIAAELGKEDAISLRSELAQELSPRDIEETLTRLSIWLEQHGQRMEKAARLTAKNHKKENGSPQSPVEALSGAPGGGKKRNMDQGQKGGVSGPTAPEATDKTPALLPPIERND